MSHLLGIIAHMQSLGGYDGTFGFYLLNTLSVLIKHHTSEVCLGQRFREDSFNQLRKALDPRLALAGQPLTATRRPPAVSGQPTMVIDDLKQLTAFWLLPEGGWR